MECGEYSGVMIVGGSRRSVLESERAILATNTAMTIGSSEGNAPRKSRKRNVICSRGRSNTSAGAV
jgi:hypothetical protein